MDIDKLLLISLLICCQIDGIIFEGILFTLLLLMLYRNGHYINRNKNYIKFILVILGYSVLMTVHLIHRGAGTSIPRLYGITKCLCGVSICILFSDRLCKKDVYHILLNFLIIYNFGAVFAEFNDIISIGNVEFILRNTCMCLNLIFWPHIFFFSRRKLRLKKLVYLGSLIMLSVSYRSHYSYYSRSFIFGWLIFIVLVAIYYIFRPLYCLSKRIRKNLLRISITCVLVLVISFLFSRTVINYYLTLLSKIDIARAEIISYGISRRGDLNQFEKVFGSGDILYPIRHGRIIQAHNFLVEVLTMYGFLGIAVLLFDMVIFWTFILKLKVSQKYPLVISLLLGYLEFFAHPFYLTSFVTKIFLVLVNINAVYCCSSRN